MFLGNVYLTTVKNRINYPDFTFAWFCYGWLRFANIITHKRVEYFINTLSTLANDIGLLNLQKTWLMGIFFCFWDAYCRMNRSSLNGIECTDSGVLSLLIEYLRVSIVNLLLMIMMNSFILLTGGWILLQMIIFRKQEPEVCVVSQFFYFNYGEKVKKQEWKIYTYFMFRKAFKMNDLSKGLPSNWYTIKLDKQFWE